MARFTVLFIAVVFCMMARPAFADGVAPPPSPCQVRYSTSPEKVRIVLDLPAAATITDQSTANAAVVTIAAPLPQPIAPLTLDDPLVSGVTVTADEQARTVLTVSLAHARKCHVFTLPASADKPFRVVVDVLKIFRQEEQQTLSPAISYTRLEEQTATRYYVAHLVNIDASDAHIRFAVVSAQGERETVASMVTRSGAVLGVNGGYFMTGTRPVGLLKVDGAIRSLPIWGRTAAAFPTSGVPVFGNPHGAWKVTLADGTTRDVPDWLDAAITTPAPSCRLANGTTISTLPANSDGLTAIIHAGKVIARPTGAVPLAREDCALVLTGDDAKALDAQLALGAVVTLAPTLVPDWTAYAHAVGAGPRLLGGGNVVVTADAERFPADIRLGRHARTGLGTTPDGHVILAVVEEPGPFGGGATLDELAELLRAAGATEAMNLDGGGSSTLAIGQNTVNYPAKAWIRPVACGVLVYDTRHTVLVANDPTTETPMH